MEGGMGPVHKVLFGQVSSCGTGTVADVGSSILC